MGKQFTFMKILVFFVPYGIIREGQPNKSQASLPLYLSIECLESNNVIHLTQALRTGGASCIRHVYFNGYYTFFLRVPCSSISGYKCETLLQDKDFLS